MTSASATPLSIRLQEIAASGKLTDLHWPNFSDYRADFLQLYQESNFSPLWLSVNGQPTPQARAIIQALESSRPKGLIPDDYDAACWQGRLAVLNTTADSTTQANFEATLTVCTHANFVCLLSGPIWSVGFLVHEIWLVPPLGLVNNETLGETGRRHECKQRKSVRQ